MLVGMWRHLPVESIFSDLLCGGLNEYQMTRTWFRTVAADRKSSPASDKACKLANRCVSSHGNHWWSVTLTPLASPSPQVKRKGPQLLWRSLVSLRHDTKLHLSYWHHTKLKHLASSAPLVLSTTQTVGNATCRTALCASGLAKSHNDFMAISSLTESSHGDVYYSLYFSHTFLATSTKHTAPGTPALLLRCSWDAWWNATSPANNGGACGRRTTHMFAWKSTRFNTNPL